MTSTQQSCSCSSVAGAFQFCGSSDSSQQAEIRNTGSIITSANQLDHFLVRWGMNCLAHRVELGLYRLGNLTPTSQVFASANYTLRFDVVRSTIAGFDAHLLVLDTKGINA